MNKLTPIFIAGAIVIAGGLRYRRRPRIRSVAHEQ